MLLLCRLQIRVTLNVAFLKLLQPKTKSIALAESSDSSRKPTPSVNAKKINEYFGPASPSRTGYIQSDRHLISPNYPNPVSLFIFM